MGKEKMPTVQQCLKKKVLFDPKKEPVWVYLEKEMLANIEKKPYNEKVGRWLKFLKDLRHHYYCEAVFKERRLKRECGPRWYLEFSTPQREILHHLHSNIHQDVLAQLPKLVRQSLFDLGITLKFTKSVLLKAMSDAMEDTGLFMWYLYEAVYHVSPTKLQKKYDMNAKLIMSSIVFIDMEECIQCLRTLTEYNATPKPVVKKKRKPNPIPDCPFGTYLQKNRKIEFYSNNPPGPRPLPKPLPLGCMVKIKSKESYTKLRLNLDCIEKRKQRSIIHVDLQRACQYKFWEPPFRNNNANEALFAIKYKLMKMKPKKKFHQPLNNVQYQVAGVSYSGNVVNFTIANVHVTSTGYIPVNDGVVISNGNRIMCIIGWWQFPKKTREHCVKPCKCIEKWENTAMDHVNASKCKCGYFYDFHHKGICQDKFFHAPTRRGPYWVDHAKVYQLDPVEDFIKNRVEDTVKSKEPTLALESPVGLFESSTRNLTKFRAKFKYFSGFGYFLHSPKPSNRMLTSDMSEEKILQDLLSNISNNALLIPHLPEAHHLNILLEWVRKRVKGKLTVDDKKKHKLVTQRRWLDLKHMDLRARAWMVPFTQKQLTNMTWEYRDKLKELETILKGDYVARNRLKQVEQAQLWWSTTKYDAYPGKPFLDIFFTYMPGRKKDTHLMNAKSPMNF